MKKIFTLFAALMMVFSLKAATETVYFVNANKWTGTITVHAWDGTAAGTTWPGLEMTKEAEQIAGCDVYSFTAEVGAYKKVIFTNKKSGSYQTGDLDWTAGKYYVKDGWYTKEGAAEKLGQPIEYESVYFVDNQGWGKANIYTWSPEVGTWPGVAMTKEADKLAGYDVYSYKVEKGGTYALVINSGKGASPWYTIASKTPFTALTATKEVYLFSAQEIYAPGKLLGNNDLQVTTTPAESYEYSIDGGEKVELITPKTVKIPMPEKAVVKIKFARVSRPLEIKSWCQNFMLSFPGCQSPFIFFGPDRAVEIVK